MRIGSSTLVAIKKAVPNCRLRPGGLPHRRLRSELPRLLPALPRLPHRQKHHVYVPVFPTLVLVKPKATFCYLRYVEHCGRPISVRVLPIGIPFARFEQMSKEAPSILPQDSKVEIEHEKTSMLNRFVHRLSLVWTGWTTRRGWWRGCAPSSGCSRSTPSGSARCSSSRSPSPPGRTSSSTRQVPCPRVFYFKFTTLVDHEVRL